MCWRREESKSDSCSSSRQGRGSTEADAAPSGGFWTKERIAIVVGTATWVVVGLVAFTSGFVVQAADGGGLTVVQTIYVMSQIITTVGYGDFTPKTDAGMLFSAIYISLSALIFSGVIMEVIDFFVDKEQSEAGAALSVLFGKLPGERSCIERHRGLLTAALCFTAAIVAWMLFFMYYCDPFQGSCEEMGAVKAFYFSIVTMCGVGFGDVTPRTVGGELYAAVASIIGLVTYVNFVGAISDTFLKAKQHRRLVTLNYQDFLAADDSTDGRIDLYEFTRFVLTRYKIVSVEVLEDIKSNFHELDADHSGEITLEDLAMLVKNSRDNG